MAHLPTIRIKPAGQGCSVSCALLEHDSVHPGPRSTYCQGYLGFAKMYLELLELLLELLLQLLLELLLVLLLLLLFSLPWTW